MFRLTQKFSKGLWALLAILTIATSLFGSFLTTSSVHAADPSPKSGGCVGNGTSTGLTSPFSQTSKMCLGDDGSGRRFFQFAVKLDKAVPVTVTAKSGSGTSISFAEQSSTLYVSKPNGQSMGYPASVLGISPPCNESDKNNIITITTKGPVNTDTKTINLCSYKGSSSQSLIYYTASSIKDSTGAPTSSTGSILGNLGSQRDDPLVPDNLKKAPLSKDYVSSFSLTGPTTITGSSTLPASSDSGKGFNLTNGKLTIEGLKPGTYTLKIVYNDKAAINAQGGDAGWTSDITYEFKNIVVLAGAPTWIGGSSDSKVYYASPTSAGATSQTPEDDKSSCAIEAIGWIVCPVINFLSKVADNCFTFLADSFLRTDPKVFNTETPAYKAWAVMRNIANVLFVIAFLFIVFSQLTGMGISNYGVKKMLPRIVVAAILVNVSYFIAQLAIDISNILGYSIRDVFGGISDSVNKATSGSASDISNFATGGGGGFEQVAGTIIASGLAIGTVYLLLSAFGPILLAAVLALVMILFILVARQAIILLLVVLSPIAFVAFLLPNTESLFKQWRKLLTTMLLLFPIIALVFGASALASTLLANTFTGAVSGDSSNVFGQIIASAILILPLFAVPVILKKALDGVPMVGQFASKWANKGFSNATGKAKEGYQKSLIGRGAAIRKNARENYRSKQFAKRVTQSGFMGAINRAAAGGQKLTPAGKASADALQKVASAATYKAQVEEVEDAKKLIENENLSGAERQALALNGRVTTSSGKVIKGEVAQRAAIQMQLGGAGSMGQIHEIVQASSTSLSHFSQTIGQGATGSTTKDPALGGRSIDEMTQGTFNYEAAVQRAIKEGKYSAEAFASMHDTAREKAIAVARAAEAAGDPSLIQSLQAAIKGIDASPQLTAKLAGNQVATLQINGLRPQNPPSRAAEQARATAASAAQGTTGDGTFVVDHTGDTTRTPPTTPPSSTPPSA